MGRGGHKEKMVLGEVRRYWGEVRRYWGELRCYDWAGRGLVTGRVGWAQGNATLLAEGQADVWGRSSLMIRLERGALRLCARA